MKFENRGWNSTKNAILYLYSFMRGCAPKYFSDEGVLELFDDDYFDKNDPIRNVENYLDMRYAGMGIKMTEILLKELSSKNSQLDESNPNVQIAKRFFESQIPQYPRSEIRLLNSKFVTRYNREMYDLDKTLNIDGCVFVKGVASLMEKKLHDAYYLCLLRGGDNKSVESGDGIADLICGSHRVYDYQTKKIYWVSYFAHDYALKGAFDAGNMQAVNHILLNRIEKCPNDYLILGEDDGCMNPFSMLPVGFKNRTKMTNLNMFFENSENEYLKKALHATLDEFRINVVSHEEFDYAVDIAESIKKSYELFLNAAKNVENLYDENAMKAHAKEIYKIIKPKNAVEQVIHRKDDTRSELCHYLKGVKETNDQAIQNESESLEIALSLYDSKKRVK